VTRTAGLGRILIAAVLATLGVVIVANVAGGAADPAQLSGWADPDGGWHGILQSAGLLFFAFAGYARIATMGEEVRNPQRTIPRAILVALSVTVGIYAAVAVTLLLVLGPRPGWPTPPLRCSPRSGLTGGTWPRRWSVSGPPQGRWVRCWP